MAGAQPSLVVWRVRLSGEEMIRSISDWIWGVSWAREAAWSLPSCVRGASRTILRGKHVVDYN